MSSFISAELFSLFFLISLVSGSHNLDSSSDLHFMVSFCIFLFGGTILTRATTMIVIAVPFMFPSFLLSFNIQLFILIFVLFCFNRWLLGTTNLFVEK